jgi:tRNA(Ile2) C34 agmatinyltransferase TiaS
MIQVIITKTVISRLFNGESFFIAKLNATLVPDKQIVKATTTSKMDAPLCITCGMMMTPNGSCYKCENCGSTSGCS